MIALNEEKGRDSKVAKKNRPATKKLLKAMISGGRNCDRYMTIEPDPARGASWLESFGSITLGSYVVELNHRPVCGGLRGDMGALGNDMQNTIAATDPKKRRILAAS